MSWSYVGSQLVYSTRPAACLPEAPTVANYSPREASRIQFFIQRKSFQQSILSTQFNPSTRMPTSLMMALLGNTNTLPVAYKYNTVQYKMSIQYKYTSTILPLPMSLLMELSVLKIVQDKFSPLCCINQSIIYFEGVHHTFLVYRRDNFFFFLVQFLWCHCFLCDSQGVPSRTGSPKVLGIYSLALTVVFTCWHS